eukprot:gene25067-31479_t
MNQHSECTGDLRNIAFDAEQSTALVGSACTLVFEKYHPVDTDASTQCVADRPKMSPDVATLLMGVIALDTLNMSPQAGKGTARDGYALMLLQSQARSVAPSLDALFNELSGAKTSPAFWEELNASDCLLLDYKLFEVTNNAVEKVFNIGISNNKGGALCDVLIVMGSTNEPQFTRELVVIAKSPERLADICKYLESSGDVISGDKKANAKASRKQVAPIASQYFEETGLI